MAGKRQHYIPRFLQRGFLANSSCLANKKDRTWLHRIGYPARLVGIKDIGVEDWFYSRKSAAGEVTLDDAITEFELSFSRNIKNLRSTEPGTSVDPVYAAQTVMHLVLRTAHLRQVLSFAAASIIKEIEGLCIDPNRFADKMKFNHTRLVPAVSKAIHNAAIQCMPAHFPVAFSERLLTFILQQCDGPSTEQVNAMVQSLTSACSSNLADLIRSSHNELIAKPINYNARVKILSSFVWTIEKGVDLILPDSVGIARTDDGLFNSLLFLEVAETTLVQLPIAHDRILVGRRSKNELIPDISTFNKAAAACCQNFFISTRAHNSDEIVAKIGCSSTKAMLNDIVAAAVTDVEQTQLILQKGDDPVSPREFQQKNFSYSFTLHDFGNEDIAKQYNNTVHSVIKNLSGMMPLQDLDGITVAVDYDDAVSKLGCNDPLIHSVRTVLPGVALPVTVVREGQYKKHLIFRASIANGWISDNSQIYAFSIYLLAKMLASIAYTSLFNELPHLKTSEMNRQLQTAVANVPAQYWCAKQVASIAPDEGKRYADLVIHSINHAKSEINDIRSSNTNQIDVDKILLTALKVSSSVLTYAADWIGHRDGLSDNQPFDGNCLPDRLAIYGLKSWILLFARDLSACYTKDGALNMNIVTALSRHVEPLLWSLGIFCWPESDSFRCAVSEVPLIPDHLMEQFYPTLKAYVCD